MTTSDVLRDVRLDLDGLDARSERFRQELRHRADLSREQLAALAAEFGDEMGERAAAAREALMERYHELEEDLPVEEVVHRARLGAWQALRSGLSGLLVLPAMLVRGLGAVSSLVDDVSARGADLSERGRELVSAVPPSRAEQRRSRVRTARVAGLGFLAGLVTGWILAHRNRTVVTYEPALPADGEPTLTREDLPQRPEPSAADVRIDIDIDVAEPSEPDPGRDA